MVTCEIHLDIRGLAVAAFRTRRGERVPPEILDVIHVLWVRSQLTNQLVVVRVCVGTERLLTLQDDHREAVGIGFLEYLAHVLHRLVRRRVFGHLRYGAFLADVFQRRYGEEQYGSDRQPPDDDRNRQSVDRPRDERWTVSHQVVAHVAFERVKAGLITAGLILSALTSPSAGVSDTVTFPCAPGSGGGNVPADGSRTRPGGGERVAATRTSVPIARQSKES